MECVHVSIKIEKKTLVTAIYCQPLNMAFMLRGNFQLVAKTCDMLNYLADQAFSNIYITIIIIPLSILEKFLCLKFNVLLVITFYASIMSLQRVPYGED